MQVPLAAAQNDDSLAAQAVRAAGDRNLGPDLEADRLRPSGRVVVIVVEADLHRRPERGRHRHVERERSRDRAFQHVRAVEVQLEVVDDAEVQLEVGDHQAPGGRAADDAELEVGLGDARVLPFEIRRLEPGARARAHGGRLRNRDRRRHQRGADRAGTHCLWRLLRGATFAFLF